MDVSPRLPNRRQRIAHARPRKTQWLMLLAGFLALSLALTVQVLGFARNDDALTVHGAPITHLDGTPTTSASTPTLTVEVPSSGQGPVGAHLTIVGSNWGTDDVLMGIAAPGASCSDPNGWAQTFNHARPHADSSITFTFDWPNTLTATGGAYSICAFSSAGVASAAYQLLSASPPTLTVTPTTTNAGSVVTISGANFVGSSSLTLSVTSGQGGTHELTAVSPDGSGSFNVPYQPRPTDLGDVTLRAYASAPKGLRPALDVTTTLHVDPALTPTPGVTPTTAVVTPSNGGDNGSTLLVIVLVAAGVLLALLAVAGVFFFMMRKRNRPENGMGYTPGYPGGSGPGYSRPGNMYNDLYQDGGYGGAGSMGNPGWDAPTQGYSTYQEGGYPPQPGFGNDANGWPESDLPDPAWRPRPMTGQWHAPDGYADVPDGGYGAGGSGNYYPPEDPWANPGSSYTQPGQPYGGGQSYGGGSDGGARLPRDPWGRSAGSEPGRGSSGGTRGNTGDRSPGQRPDDDW